MKRLLVGTLGSVLSGFSVSANAGLLADPVGRSEAGSQQLGVHYSSATTTYKIRCSGCADGDFEGDVKREGITVYRVYGLNDTTDIFGGITYNIKTELDKVDGEKFDIGGESGFELGVGIRGDLLSLNSVKLVGYIQLAYISDELMSSVETSYENGEFRKETDNLSVSGLELSGGVIGISNVSEALSLYGGLELIPFGTMKEDYKWSYEYRGSWGQSEGEGSASDDYDRDSILGIRLGGKYMMNDEVFVRGEFAAVGEKSLTIGAGVSF